MLADERPLKEDGRIGLAGFGVGAYDVRAAFPQGPVTLGTLVADGPGTHGFLMEYRPANLRVRLLDEGGPVPLLYPVIRSSSFGRTSVTRGLGAPGQLEDDSVFFEDLAPGEYVLDLPKWDEFWGASATAIPLTVQAGTDTELAWGGPSTSDALDLLTDVPPELQDQPLYVAVVGDSALPVFAANLSWVRVLPEQSTRLRVPLRTSCRLIFAVSDAPESKTLDVQVVGLMSWTSSSGEGAALHVTIEAPATLVLTCPPSRSMCVEIRHEALQGVIRPTSCCFRGTLRWRSMPGRVSVVPQDGAVSTATGRQVTLAAGQVTEVNM